MSLFLLNGVIPYDHLCSVLLVCDLFLTQDLPVSLVLPQFVILFLPV